jgi:hypothetical protein
MVHRGGRGRAPPKDPAMPPRGHRQGKTAASTAADAFTAEDRLVLVQAVGEGREHDHLAVGRDHIANALFHGPLTAARYGPRADHAIQAIPSGSADNCPLNLGGLHYSCFSVCAVSLGVANTSFAWVNLRRCNLTQTVCLGFAAAPIMRISLANTNGS